MGMVYKRTYNKTYKVDYSLKLKEIIDYQTYLKKYCKKQSPSPVEQDMFIINKKMELPVNGR